MDTRERPPEPTTTPAPNPAEIERRKAFLEFTEQDIALLKELHARIEATGECAFFVDDFYRHLLAFPETRALIPNERVLARLKATQTEYFHSLTAGDYGPDYVADRVRVGTVHQRVGLDTQWYIGAYNKYLTLLLPKIAELTAEASSAAAARKVMDTYAAALKITFFDLGLAIDTYIDANHAAIRRKAAELTALNQLAVAVSSSLDLKDILDKIIQHGMQLSGSRAVCAALYSEENGRFREWIAKGLSEDSIKTMLFHAGGAPLAAMAQGTCIQASDATGSAYPLGEAERAEGIRAVICLPLTARAHTLGVLCFYRGDRDSFAPDEVELFSTFAGLAAEAIENARVHARTATLAAMDQLTTLPNRRSFDERLAVELHRGRRYGAPFSLLLADIDDFKAINDTHGHPAGDAVLRTLGALLSEQLRSVDFAARYGGEEFAVLLAETDGVHARDVADRIRRKVEGAVFRLPDGDRLRATLSIGIACFPSCADSEVALVTRADQALYAAKRDGKNQAVLYRELLKRDLERDPARVVALLAGGIDNVAPLMAAVGMKAEFMRAHPAATARYARLLGEALELPTAECAALELAARLHDLGFVLLPDALLNKPAILLSEKEMAQLRQHPVSGAELLAQVPALAHLAPIVRHHHERYDGSGYPDKLTGAAIPYLARVLAVVDVYDAMTADRPQRGSLVPEDAKAQLLAGAGRLFDPVIVTAFIQALEAEQPPRHDETAAAALDAGRG